MGTDWSTSMLLFVAVSESAMAGVDSNSMALRLNVRFMVSPRNRPFD